MLHIINITMLNKYVLITAHWTGSPRRCHACLACVDIETEVETAYIVHVETAYIVHATAYIDHTTAYIAHTTAYINHTF